MLPADLDIDSVPTPDGVKLRDPNDTDSLRADIENGMVNAFQRYVHGYEYGGTRLELGDLHYAGKDRFSIEEQREALMRDATLARRLKGTVTLVDVATGKPLDTRKNITLARVPYLTDRGTMINNGSEYAPIMQSRLLPGAYTRRRANGELETHFNVRPGSGSAMRVMLDPQTAQFRLRVGTSNVHAYSVFKDLGVSDEELARRWGPEVLESNRNGYDAGAVERVYAKAVPKWQQDATLTREAKILAVREALDRAQVAETVLRDNLPNLFSQEKAASWRAAGAIIEAANARADELTKSASHLDFLPDLTPDQLLGAVCEMDFEMDLALNKSANFHPDLQPGEMREAYNAIYGHAGPRLASMKEWPEHWLNDTDPSGWLEWYERYSDGRRHETDTKQIGRWASFKARHGAMFRLKPTPRRAFALRNWAIDPLQLLPKERRESFAGEMERYRRKEFMRWALNRFDFNDEMAAALQEKARSRGGATIPGENQSGSLMRLALEGHITPDDLKP